MALADIILRVTPHLPQFTKGSELTWPEMDNNWIELIDFVSSLNGTGNVAPYNPLQAYPLNDANGNPIPSYVSYNGNIYLFVGVPYQTGVTPGTNPAVWQLVSSGALAHVQNTDLYLNLGGPFEVSALDLHNLLLTQMQIVTKAQLDAIIAFGGGALKPGYPYFITDRNIIVRAVGSALLDPQCIILAPCADFQNISTLVSGMFDGSMLLGVVPINSIWIWKNLHYQNTTGVTSGAYPDADGANWTGIPITDPTYQYEIHYGIYRWVAGATGDRITERTDPKRKIKYKAPEYDRNFTASPTYDFLPNIFFPWGNDAHIDVEIIEQEVDLSIFKGTLKGVKFLKDKNAGAADNVIELSDLGTADWSHTIFEGCKTTTFYIPTNTLLSCRFRGITLQDIPVTQNMTGNTVTETESDFTFTADITGLTTLDLDGYGISGIVGRVALASSNAFETLAQIVTTSRRILKITSNILGVTINQTVNILLNGLRSELTLTNDGYSYIKVENISGVFRQHEAYENTGGGIETYLPADVPLVAGVYANARQLNLTPGLWLIECAALVENPVITIGQVTAKLWDGVTVYSSTEISLPLTGAGVFPTGQVNLVKLIAVNVLTTFLFDINSVAGGNIKQAPNTNAAGCARTATWMRATLLK